VKTAILIFVLTFFSQIVDTAMSLDEKKRDLSRYETVGPFVEPVLLRASERAKIDAKLRKFLWNHWQRRTLGVAAITVYSKEGAPSTTNYFIEPDTSNNWRIAIEIERTRLDRIAGKAVRESDNFEAYSVERVEPAKDGMTPRTVISEKERRSSDSYRLLLRGHEGQVLSEF
jgi:hypothetical protein